MDISNLQNGVYIIKLGNDTSKLSRNKMKNHELILTVQPTGTKEKRAWRLGVSLKDSEEIFRGRGLLIDFMLGKISTQAKTACGPPLKKGFDFNGKVIHEWIIKNNFHLYVEGKPTKLLFQYSEKEQKLIFIKKI